MFSFRVGRNPELGRDDLPRRRGQADEQGPSGAITYARQLRDRSVALAVTVAPGMANPARSCTSTSMVPVSVTCATAGVEATASSASAATTDGQKCLMVFTAVLPTR